MPTQIRFGAGRINELKSICPKYGKRCLLVSRPINGSQKATYEKIANILSDTGVTLFHYDKVVPNPTIEGVEEGVAAAVKHNVDFVLGVGGGSVMDSAKLIAFLHHKEAKVNWEDAMNTYDHPFEYAKTPSSSLPFIAVSTTSGSGSQCTQAAVVSDLKQKTKITLFHSNLFPKVAIIDPELMLTVPANVTAATGFDAFTHAFESFLGGRTSPQTEAMSLQVIEAVFKYLPKVIETPADLESRTHMAWADTLAGMCLANGGADLPHPLGEIIGGICPRISHGETLAIVYPEFLKYKSQIAGEKFDKVEKLLNSGNEQVTLLSLVKKLFDQVNLTDALSRAALSEDELSLISNHPLLSHLQPENSEKIKNIMNKSLQI